MCSARAKFIRGSMREPLKTHAHTHTRNTQARIASQRPPTAVAASATHPPTHPVSPGPAHPSIWYQQLLRHGAGVVRVRKVSAPGHTRVHACARTHTCIHACTYECMHASARTQAHARTRACAHTHIPPPPARTQTNEYRHARTHTHSSTHARVLARSYTNTLSMQPFRRRHRFRGWCRAGRRIAAGGSESETS